MQFASPSIARARVAEPGVCARVGTLLSNRTSALATVLIATVVAALPCWKRVWYQDDQLPTVFRTLHTDLARLHGVLVPRMAFELGFGYGQLLHQVYPPLGFELTAWLHTLGFGYVESARMFFTLCLLSASLGMYACAIRVLRRRWCAVLAAVAYVWAPYVLLDVHPGGDFGESLALGLLPWCLAAFQSLVSRASWASFGAAALSLAAVILAHNIISLLFMGLLVAYVGVLAARLLLGRGVRAALEWIGQAAGAVLLALGVGAIYWLPALVEMPFTRIADQSTGSFNVLRYLTTPTALLQQGFRFQYDLANQSRYGLVALLVTVGAIALFVAAAWRPARLRGRARNDRDQQPDRLVIAGLGVAFGVVLLLQLRVSEPVWTGVPLISFAQFPRRLFVFASLAGALIVGTLPWSLAWLGATRLVQAAVGCLVLATLGASSLPGVFWSAPVPPAHVIADQDVAIGSAADRRFSQRSAYDDFFPAWVQETQAEIQDPPRRPQLYRAANDLPAPHLVLQEWTYGYVHLVTEADSTAGVVLHTFYFPGWRATANGEPIPVEPVGPLGLLRVTVPPGHQDVVVTFGDTPVRIVASAASVLSGLLLLGVLARGFGLRQTLAIGGLVSLGLLVPWLTYLHASPPPDPPLRTTEQQVTPAARVVGVRQERSSYRAGATVSVGVIWQATAYTDLDQQSGLRLVSVESGQALAERWSRPNLDRTPTGKWLLGELVPDRLSVVVPGSTPPGRYRLVAGLRIGASSASTPVGEIEVR